MISQVYGGGGNSGATYTHDFVELYNNGKLAVPTDLPLRTMTTRTVDKEPKWRRAGRELQPSR